MRIDWRTDRNAPSPCRVVDLDTGTQIAYCAWADEETGEYERYVLTDDNRFVIGADKKVETIRGRARLQIVMLEPDEPYLLPTEPDPGDVVYGSDQCPRRTLQRK